MTPELEALAIEVQKKIEALYKERNVSYQNTEFVGESSGSRCRAVYKNKEIIDITIQDGVPRELIPDLVIIAVNKALHLATEKHRQLQKEIDAEALAITIEASKQAMDLIAPLPPEGELPKNVISLDKNKN